MRKSFEMTEAQLAKLYEAIKPVPYIIFGGMAPASPQERANDFWTALGREMGFDGMSVRPDGRGDRFFTAEVAEVVNE